MLCRQSATLLYDCVLCDELVPYVCDRADDMVISQSIIYYFAHRYRQSDNVLTPEITHCKCKLPCLSDTEVYSG